MPPKKKVNKKAKKAKQNEQKQSAAKPQSAAVTTKSSQSPATEQKAIVTPGKTNLLGKAIQGAIQFDFDDFIKIINKVNSDTKGNLKQVVNQYVFQSASGMRVGIMHMLAMRGDLRKIKELIEKHQIDPFFFNEKEGVTASMLSPAAAAGQLAVVKYLCQLKPVKPDLQIMGSALFEAVGTDELDIVKFFIIDMCVDKNILNSERQTLLEVAYKTDSKTGKKLRPVCQVATFLEKHFKEAKSQPVMLKSNETFMIEGFQKIYDESISRYLPSRPDLQISYLHNCQAKSRWPAITIELYVTSATKLDHVWVVENFFERYQLHAEASIKEEFKRESLVEVLKKVAPPKGKVADYLQKISELYKLRPGTSQQEDLHPCFLAINERNYNLAYRCLLQEKSRNQLTAIFLCGMFELYGLGDAKINRDVFKDCRIFDIEEASLSPSGAYKIKLTGVTNVEEKHAQFIKDKNFIKLINNAKAIIYINKMMHIIDDNDVVALTKYIENGKFLESISDAQGKNFLHHACAKGRLAIVRILIEQSRINVNAQTADGSSALHLALQNGHINVAEYLISDSHINVTLRNHQNQLASDFIKQLALDPLEMDRLRTLCQLNEKVKRKPSKSKPIIVLNKPFRSVYKLQRKHADKSIESKSGLSDAISIYKTLADQHGDKRSARRLALCAYKQLIPQSDKDAEGLINFKNAIEKKDQIASAIYANAKAKDDKNLYFLWQTLSYLRQACALGDTLAALYLAALSGNNEIAANITFAELNTVRQDWEVDFKIFNVTDPLNSAMSRLAKDIEKRSTVTEHKETEKDERPKHIISIINQLISSADEKVADDKSVEKKEDESLKNKDRSQLLGELNDLLTTFTFHQKTTLFQSDAWMQGITAALNGSHPDKFLLQLQQLESKLNPNDKQLHQYEAIDNFHLLENMLPRYTTLLSDSANDWMKPIIAAELNAGTKPLLVLSAAILYKFFISPSLERNHKGDALGVYFVLDTEVFNKRTKQFVKTADFALLSGTLTLADFKKELRLYLPKFHANNPAKCVMLTDIPKTIYELFKLNGKQPDHDTLMANIVDLIKQATTEQRSQLPHLQQWQHEVKKHLHTHIQQNQCMALLTELKKQSGFDFPHSVYPDYFNSLAKLETATNPWASEWINKAVTSGTVSYFHYKALTLYPQYQYLAKCKCRQLTSYEIDVFLHQLKPEISETDSNSHLMKLFESLYDADPSIEAVHKTKLAIETKEQATPSSTPKSQPTQSVAKVMQALTETKQVQEVKTEYKIASHEIKFIVAKDGYPKWKKLIDTWKVLMKYGLTLPVGGAVLDMLLASIYSQPLVFKDIDFIHVGDSKVIAEKADLDLRSSARNQGDRTLLRSKDIDVEVIASTEKVLSTLLTQDVRVRDFPCNAMYLDPEKFPQEVALSNGNVEVTATVLDLLNGFEAVKEKRMQSHTHLYGLDACVIHRLLLTTAKIQADAKSIAAIDLKVAAAHLDDIWHGLPWRVMEYFNKLFVSSNAVKHFKLCVEAGFFPRLLFPAALTRDLKYSAEELRSAAEHICVELGLFVNELQENLIATRKATWDEISSTSSLQAVASRSCAYGFMLGHLYNQFVNENPDRDITNWEEFFNRKVDILINSFVKESVNPERPILYKQDVVAAAMEVINEKLLLEHKETAKVQREDKTVLSDENEELFLTPSQTPSDVAESRLKFESLKQAIDIYNLAPNYPNFAKIGDVAAPGETQPFNIIYKALGIMRREIFDLKYNEMNVMLMQKRLMTLISQFTQFPKDDTPESCILVSKIFVEIGAIKPVAKSLFSEEMNRTVLHALIDVAKSSALDANSIVRILYALSRMTSKQNIISHRNLEHISLLLLDKLSSSISTLSCKAAVIALNCFCLLAYDHSITRNQINLRIMILLKLLNKVTSNIKRISSNEIQSIIYPLSKISLNCTSLQILKHVAAIPKLVMHFHWDEGYRSSQQSFAYLLNGLKNFDYAHSCPDLTPVSNHIIGLLNTFIMSPDKLQFKTLHLILTAFSFLEKNIVEFGSLKNKLICRLMRNVLNFPKVSNDGFSILVASIAKYDIPLKDISDFLPILLSRSIQIVRDSCLSPQLYKRDIFFLKRLNFFFGYCKLNGIADEAFNQLHLILQEVRVKQLTPIDPSVHKYFTLLATNCLSLGYEIQLRPAYHESGCDIDIAVFDKSHNKLMAICISSKDIKLNDVEFELSNSLRERNLKLLGWPIVRHYELPAQKIYQHASMIKDIAAAMALLSSLFAAPLVQYAAPLVSEAKHQPATAVPGITLYAMPLPALVAVQTSATTVAATPPEAAPSHFAPPFTFASLSSS